MSDDSFIREVEEELRNERLQNFWKNYGKLIIAAAVAIVLVTGGFRAYEWYTAQQAAAEGDAFMEAVRLTQGDDADAASNALSKLASEGSPAYKASAQMRLAAELAKAGEFDKAIEQYDKIIADNAADENFRAIARLRAGFILVDTGSVTDVEARVGSLTGPGAPYRGSAREALGMAYYKAGDLENAFKQFDAVQVDEGTPQGMRERVRIMLELIASNGGPVKQ